MKNYLVEALAIQLDGETENLLVLHQDLKSQKISTAEYTEVAELLLDATNALCNVVFGLVATIWNINRPAEHPLKSFPKSVHVRGVTKVEQALQLLKGISKSELETIVAKLGQSTKES